MYIKKIADFIDDVSNHFQDNILDELKSNNAVHGSEIQSWENSLPVVAGILNTLSARIKNSAEIILEAKQEMEEKRADVVIVGTKKGEPVLVMIENKGWSNLSEYPPVGDYCVVDPYQGNKPTYHPCRQVTHYKEMLLYTNAYVQDSDAEIVTAVLLHNATEAERAGCVGPFSECFRALIRNNPIFISEDGLGVQKTLCEYIEDHLDGGKKGLAEKVYKSEARYSPEYKRILANVMGNRKELISLLDDKQIELFEEISESVYKIAGVSDRRLAPQEKTVYIVEGGPGTGKTFVAVALLSYLYQQHTDQNASLKAALLLKNKDPRMALEREMGVEGGAIKFGLKGDRSIYDCLICDESHRNLEKVWEKNQEDMRDTLEATMQMGNVSVFFYDSKQHVHINDYVTKERILKAAEKQGIPEERIIQRKLTYQHRCRDSEHFLRFVDQLLYYPEQGLNGIERFESDEAYQVALVEDPQALFTLIREKNANGNGEKASRVLAGKGRTDGRDWCWWWDDTEMRSTVGPFRNLQGAFTWNKRSYIRPQTFASDKSSIGNVGCIDTSQGLDFEYVGIILAPDLVYDTAANRVKVDLSGHLREDPNTDLGRPNINEDDLIRIIKNTYFVLLTRGTKGCYLYCCDENLQEYLKRILPVLHVPEGDEVDWDELDMRAKNAAGTASFIGNKYNNRFHHPDCRFAPKNPAKRVEFASREDAVNAEYSPCPACNP